MISLKDRIQDILFRNNLITKEQLEYALDIQKKKGGRLSEIVVQEKFVRESDLILALSEGLNFPLIDLKKFKLDAEITKLIPADVARHYQIIPISKMGDTITLAMADPLNIFAIDHVESFTGFKINPIISASQDIIAAIETAYPDNTKEVLNDLVQEISDTAIEVIKEGKSPFDDSNVSEANFQAPAIQITDLVLEESIKRRASDILIEPFENKVRVRYRVDGFLQEGQSPTKNMHSSVVSRIKVMSDLNIAEHRLPQDGRFKARVSGKEVDFRVSILPSIFGEKVAIRILDKSQAKLDIAGLGFSEDTVKLLQKVSKFPHGMVLVCGPTGAGKTTTLYSVLKFVDSPEKNIVTVEDPVEYQLEGINQITIRPDVGLTFASSLRAILRQDPNVIMIGEIRDYETVDIAIKSALTGHLVLSTLHTTTAVGSVVRLINMGVEPFMMNSAVVCIMAQRLLRKICPNCKEEYKISEEVLSRLKIKTNSESKFFKGKGCPRCFNSGFLGRVGIAEVLVLTPAVRDIILKSGQEHVIKLQARKEGMRTLREDGMRAIFAGLTTIEEVVRITAADE